MPTYLKSSVPKQADDARLASVKETVTEVIADVRERGDAAVRQYSEKFDRWSPESFRLTADQIEDEIFGCLDFAAIIYGLFGMDARFELSTRPQNKLGTDEEWRGE